MKIPKKEKEIVSKENLIGKAVKSKGVKVNFKEEDGGGGTTEVERAGRVQQQQEGAERPGGGQGRPGQCQLRRGGRDPAGLRRQ